MTTSPDERYERLLEIQSLLAQVSRDVGPALDLDLVLTRVLAAMRSLVTFDGAAVSLLEDDHLLVAAADPPVPEGRTPFRVASHGGLPAQVVRSGSSQLSGDVSTDERVPEALQRFARKLGAVSFLCVPLICLGDVIGVIAVYSSETDAFAEEDRVLLEGLATQVAGAIESARRYELISELEVLKSDFIARVSHELRTPITIMGGFVSTLLSHDEQLDGDTRRRMLERIDTATSRLSGLIDELLLLTRLEAGVVAAAIEPVALAPVLDDLRRQSLVPDAVTIDCPRDVRIDTDPALLLRALGFLVDNALKYAGSCRVVATETTISVIDRGPGIPADRRSLVFERFTRTNEDTTVAGMGIGLPMARTLLAAVGADVVWREPEDGVGTRMVVHFGGVLH